jgi:hypothetical protein
MVTKAADAAKTNELDTNKGVNDVRKNPEDRSPGTLDAKWGDHPTPSPDVYSTAVVREAHDGRASLIDRIFDSQKTTAPAEQSLMRQNFVNMAQGNPHSPILQRGKEPEKVASDETLTDQVTRVVGHL